MKNMEALKLLWNCFLESYEDSEQTFSFDKSRCRIPRAKYTYNCSYFDLLRHIALIIFIILTLTPYACKNTYLSLIYYGLHLEVVLRNMKRRKAFCTFSLW